MIRRVLRDLKAEVRAPNGGERVLPLKEGIKEGIDSKADRNPRRITVGPRIRYYLNWLGNELGINGKLGIKPGIEEI